MAEFRERGRNIVCEAVTVTWVKVIRALNGGSCSGRDDDSRSLSGQIGTC